MLRGADVSKYQGTIDWPQFGPNLDFVIIKATDGLKCVDTQFARNKEEAEKLGIIRGYYHFARPAQSAQAQADFFCDKVGALKPGELDLVLDLEHTKHGDDGTTEKQTWTAADTAELVEWTRTFIDAVKSRCPGRGVIVYTGYWFWQKRLGGCEDFCEYPLWMAAYPFKDAPPASSADWEAWALRQELKRFAPWSTWTFWQFSDKARIPGVTVNTVDANLFKGSLSDLQRLARMNEIVYPIDAAAKEIYALNEGGEGGYYPVGSNNFWHGGVHLQTSAALRAVADGTLVAYRISKKPLAVELGPEPLPMSNGFVLTRHERFTPKGAKIEWFTLYQHMLPLDHYADEQKAAPPPLFSKPKLVLSTKEDGRGLGVREDEGGAPVGIIPRGAHFTVVPTDTAPWDASCKRVKYGALTGYAPIEGRAKVVSGTTYVCLTDEDSPAEELLGLNVREKGAGSRVLRVEPDGTPLDFKDPAAVTAGGTITAGWHELKAGGKVYVRTAPTPNFRVTHTLEGAELDKVVEVGKPVSSGVILGYPGPYLSPEPTVHIEIFTPDIGFMKNPKGDEGGPTTFKIPAGTVFKKRTTLPDELIQIDAPAEARLVVVKDGSPYRKVAVAEIIGWAARDALGDYDGAKKEYTLRAPLAALWLNDPEDDPDGPKVTIDAKAGAKLKYIIQSGDHRKVAYVLSKAERDAKTGFAAEAECGKYSKALSRYILAAPLPTLHRTDPACLFEWKEDAGTSDKELFVDLPPLPDPTVCKDAEGKTWQEAELAPGKKGWFRHDQQGVKALSAYDWPRWQRIQEYQNFSDDGLCDAAELVSALDANDDGVITAQELKAALAVPEVAERLRHLACLHPTEWAGELKGLSRLQFPPWNLGKAALDATKAYIEKLGFWNDVKKGGLPAKDKVWHLHPIGFLEHLKSLTLTARPSTSSAGPSPTTEIFLLCEHEFDSRQRSIKLKKGPFEVVASVDSGKDRVTILHRDSVGESPSELQVECQGEKTTIKPAGEEAGSAYTKYELDCAHRGPKSYNILSSSYWKDLLGPTIHTVKGVDPPIEIAAYPPHAWKLTIKFPAMRGLEVGSKLENQAAVVAGPGYIGAAKRTTASVNVEKTGWRQLKETATAEKTTTKGFLATPNQLVVAKETTLKQTYEVEKDDSGIVDGVSLTRDDKEIELKELDQFFTLVEAANDILGVIRAVQDAVPKVGWYANFELQVLQGKFSVEWQWRETTTQQAFLYFKTGIEISLLSISLEIGVGVSGCAFKAQVFAKLEGSVDVSCSVEREGPKSWNVLQIPIKATIKASVGARFEAGNFVKLEGTFESALEFEGTFSINTTAGLKASLGSRWTGLKGVVSVSAGKGGSLGSYKKEQTFVDAVELGKIDWPDPKPYQPEFVTRAGIEAILIESLTEGWNVRVFTPSGYALIPDRQWTNQEIASVLAKRIDARNDIRRDGQSIDGLAHDIRARLAELAKRDWARDWLDNVRFEKYVNGGELDKLMTTKYIDPCKEVLGRLQKKK